ncbi:MAG: DUF2993 domain-containing protein [Elainellaceae cyanobacterium]
MGKDLGEETLSNLAEAGIKSQLDKSDQVNVDINADSADIVQGKVDSVEIDGKGMEMKDGLRMEEMHLQTNAVDLDVMSTMFGDVKLEQSTQASAQVVLTEEDINRAFNSKFIQQKMQGLELSIEGQPAQANVQGVQFELMDSGKVGLTAWVEVNQDRRKTAFTAMPQVSADHHQVILEQVEHANGAEFSSDLTQALLEQSRQLLDLRNFELEGMRLRLKELSVEGDRMTLLGEADVEEFPSD